MHAYGAEQRRGFMEEYLPSEWVDEGVAGLLVDDRHELTA